MKKQSIFKRIRNKHKNTGNKYDKQVETMSVLITTLGGSEDIVKIGVRVMENVDMVQIVAGRPLTEILKEREIKSDKMLIDPVKKAYELKELLNRLGIEVQIHKVNPLDFEECLLKIIELIKGNSGTETAVNLTGGTKTLSLAALSAAWICGCRAFIIQESNTGCSKLELPTVNPGAITEIGEQAKRILTYMVKKMNALGQNITECDDEKLRPLMAKMIATGLGVEPQSITGNLASMEAHGLVNSRRGSVKRGPPSHGKMSVKFWYLTDKGKIYATLFSSEGIK